MQVAFEGLYKTRTVCLGASPRTSVRSHCILMKLAGLIPSHDLNSGVRMNGNASY